MSAPFCVKRRFLAHLGVDGNVFARAGRCLDCQRQRDAPAELKWSRQSAQCDAVGARAQGDRCPGRQLERGGGVPAAAARGDQRRTGGDGRAYADQRRPLGAGKNHVRLGGPGSWLDPRLIDDEQRIHIGSGQGERAAESDASNSQNPVRRTHRRRLHAWHCNGAAGDAPHGSAKCFRLGGVRRGTCWLHHADRADNANDKRRPGAPDHDAEEPARMTSGMLFALAIGTLIVFVLVGLMRRTRSPKQIDQSSGDTQTAAQWTEGETTRLLSTAEVPGLYLLRPRFLSKAENVVYLLLKAAFPRHEIFARVRLADVLQVKIGPQGMERLRAFRKIANQHVGFVVCDRDMPIVAIIDAKEPKQVQNPRDQKLEIIKQRCLQAAQAKYIRVYPPTLPRYRELRAQILGPAAELV